MTRIWKLFFVPHEHNNHRAWLIQPSFIGIFIALYLLNQSLIKSFTIFRPGILGYSSEITAQKVFDETNQMRQKAGLPLLKYNPTLSRSATDKANDMFSNNYWAHNSPSGKTPWDFFIADGYRYSIAGENLAKDFYDTDTMMRAWMNSPTHKANIINTKYQEIGIGVVNGVLNGVKTTLVVQHFATPAPAKAVTKTPEPTEIVDTPVVLSDIVSPPTIPTKELISPLQISQLVGSVMFAIIIGVLSIDIYVTLKNKTHRLTGSSVGHIGFLAILFLLLVVSRSGAIF